MGNPMPSGTNLKNYWKVPKIAIQDGRHRKKCQIFKITKIANYLLKK